jgi:hypothetical protein
MRLQRAWQPVHSKGARFFIALFYFFKGNAAMAPLDSRGRFSPMGVGLGRSRGRGEGRGEGGVGVGVGVGVLQADML